MTYHIPSQEALSQLICDCQLLKNVILICDYDLECPVNTDAVSYIPFQSISAEPEPKKVRAFLQQNHITDDD
ncbi:MAG: hypothetical protein LUH55_00805, partial [Bacteroides thetaiotaomicron]|nr:hypothetical protein [Bacteroides thetaiotaomicron]